MRARFGLALWLGLFISALPHVVAAQAAQQTAPPAIEPQRFEKEIAEFDAEDKTSMPPQGAIVITGSSSIRRWHPTMKQDLAGLTVIPRGFGGAEAAAQTLSVVLLDPRGKRQPAQLPAGCPRLPPRLLPPQERRLEAKQTFQAQVVGRRRNRKNADLLHHGAGQGNGRNRGSTDALQRRDCSLQVATRGRAFRVQRGIPQE